MLAVRTIDGLAQTQTGSLLGADTIAQGIADATSSVTYFVSAFLAQPWVYYALLVAGAVGIGLLVYVVLQATTGFALNVEETIAEAHTSGEATKRAFGESFGARLVIRFIVAAVIAAYVQLAITVLAPFCLNAWDIATAALGTWQGWAQCAGVIVGLSAMLHVCVVLLRLLFLRPRMFGGRYQILEALD